MSTDPVNEPFAFVQDEAPRLLPARGPRRPSSFRRLWIGFVFISLDVGILACTLHVLRIVAIPGLPPMDEVKPAAAPATAPAETKSPAPVAGSIVAAKRGRPAGYASTEKTAPKMRHPAAEDAGDAPLAKDLSPEEVLESEGLERSGAGYALGDESDLQKSLEKTRALLAQVKAAYKQLGPVMVQFNRLNGSLELLENHRINLEAGIANQQAFVNTLPRDGNNLIRADFQQANGELTALKAELTETNRRLNLGKKELHDARRQKDDALRVFRSKRSDYLREGARLQRAYDSLIEDYDSLAKDAKVRKSLESLGRASGTSLKVSPSKGLLQGRDELNKTLKSVEGVDVPDG